MRKNNQTIALTAPRRMGKSMTLSTLHMMKLLGLNDLLKLVMKEKQSENSRLKTTLQGAIDILKRKNESNYNRYLRCP